MTVIGLVIQENQGNVTAAASKRSNIVHELDEAKTISADCNESSVLQRADRIGLQEVFIEIDSTSMMAAMKAIRQQ